MLRTTVATSSGAPSRNCLRTASPASPNSDWYCSLGIASIHARSCCPPGCAYAASSLRPYFTSTTCQPADWRNLKRLEDAQELGLEAELEVADFVDEQRAAVGLFEAAHSAVGGAG